MPKKILNIYEYENYRDFLRDFFVERKRRCSDFSQRSFAQKAGFGSHSYLPYVIKGTRNLSPKAVEQVAQALELSEREAAYFRELVGYTQAGSSSEREARFRQMNTIRRNTSFYKLRRHQYKYFDEWYYPVIRELATMGDWHGDYEFLASLCSPNITAAEARKAVEALVEMELIVPDGGTYVQTDATVVADDLPRHLLCKARTAYMKRAIEASDRLGPDESNFSSATIALTPEQFKEISGMFDWFHRKVVAAAAETSSADRVYQLNLQLFPLSKAAPGPTGEGR